MSFHQLETSHLAEATDHDEKQRAQNIGILIDKCSDKL